MKIRAKDVKVKIKGDFAKKKAKVGRKIKKVTETKIDVKAKKIFVPGQNQITKHLADNEREELNLIIRQLRHYSLPNKLGAISELKDLLTKSAHADAYITLILPEVMEMMFDEERDVRKSVISFITFLIVQYQPESFLSIMPVVITYLCSGLTNITKAIRKDALMLLQTLCEHGSRLLVPYVEKLIRNVLSLLQDSFQTVSTAGGTQDAHVALSLTTVNAAVGTSGPSGKDSKTTAAAPKVASMFILTLQVLQALLATVVQQQQGPSATEEHTRLMFSEHSQTNSAVILTSRVKAPSSWLSKTSGSGSTSRAGLPQDLMLEICHRLRFIWQGLVLEDKPIALDTIAVLREISKIILCVAQSNGSQMHREMTSLLSLFFAFFPHSCKEATLAKPNSAEERNGSLAAQLLDIALCEIVSVFALKSKTVQDDEEDHSKATRNAKTTLYHLQQTASVYLLEKLTAHINGVKENTVRSNETNNELVTRTFSSFDLMISIDSIDVLFQLVSMMNANLFSCIASISSTETNAGVDAMEVVSESVVATSSDSLLISDLMVKSIHCIAAILDTLNMHIVASPEEELFFHQLGVAVDHLMSSKLIVKYLQKASLNDAGAEESQFSVSVHNIVRSLLHVIRRFPSCKANSDCSESQLQLIQSVLKKYISLLEHTETSKNNKKEPFFVYNNSSSEVRQLLLDVYAQAPFDLLDGAATLKVSKTLNKNIAAHSVPRAEQSYFLRLLFSKRQFMGLNDYIDLLFAGLRSNITTRCIGVFTKHGVSKLSESKSKAFHAEVIQVALDAASHSFACDVGEVLRWTASSDNPTKIIGFIMSRLVSLRDSAVDSKTGLFTCDSVGPVSNSSVWVAQFGWLGCYTASVTVLHLFRVLFESIHHGQGETASPAVVSVLKDSLAVISSVCLAVIRDSGCSESLRLSNQENIGMDLHDKYREELMTTVAEMVKVTNIIPVAQWRELIPSEKTAAYLLLLGNMDVSHSDAFCVFRSLLVEFSSVWLTQPTNADKTHMMNGLKYLLGCRNIANTVHEFKNEVSALVRALSKSVGVTVGETPDSDELADLSFVANDLVNIVSN